MTFTYFNGLARFDAQSIWKYVKRTMQKKRRVFSYDAVIERTEVQDAKMAIRAKLRQGKSHEIWQRRDQYLALAENSLPFLNQMAAALRSHAKVCTHCSSRQKQESTEQSKRLSRKVLLDDPKNGPALIALAYFYFDRKGDTFVRKVKDIIKKTGERAYNTHIGHFYKARRHYKKAEYFYRKALSGIPYHYGIMYAIAMLYLEMGKPEDAKRYASYALRRYASMGSFYQRDPVTKVCIAELKAIRKMKKRRG